jgi:hypothetical protein
VCDKLDSLSKRETCATAARKPYREQELAAAIEACDKLRRPKQRATCVVGARKKY